MALIRAHLVHGRYTLRDTLASIGMRAGNYATNVLLAGATVAVFTVIYEHRLFDIPMTAAWAWVALVVLDDFAYYWFHRISHECRFWWAAHVNHLSSQEYNLSTACITPRIRATSTATTPASSWSGTDCSARLRPSATTTRRSTG